MQYVAIIGVILFTVIIFVIAYWWTEKERKALNSAWSAFAGEQNWTVTSGENSSTPTMQGIYRDYFITAGTDSIPVGESSSDYTVLTLKLNKSLKGNFRITGREYSKTINSLQGIKEIDIGDRNFSNNYVISGSVDEWSAKKIITDEIKEKLEKARSSEGKLFTGSGIGELSAEEDTILYRIPGYVSDRNLLKANVDVLAEIAGNCEGMMGE